MKEKYDPAYTAIRKAPAGLQVLLWTVALFFKKAFYIASENPGEAI